MNNRDVDIQETKNLAKMLGYADALNEEWAPDKHDLAHCPSNLAGWLTNCSTNANSCSARADATGRDDHHELAAIAHEKARDSHSQLGVGKGYDYHAAKAATHRQILALRKNI